MTQDVSRHHLFLVATIGEYGHRFDWVLAANGDGAARFVDECLGGPHWTWVIDSSEFDEFAPGRDRTRQQHLAHMASMAAGAPKRLAAAGGGCGVLLAMAVVCLMTGNRP